MHVILFDDMLLLTRRKKGLTKKVRIISLFNSSIISKNFIYDIDSNQNLFVSLFNFQYYQASTVCRSSQGGSLMKDDGTFKYIVYKQPLSLDRLYVHDILPVDAQGNFPFPLDIICSCITDILT